MSALWRPPRLQPARLALLALLAPLAHAAADTPGPECVQGNTAFAIDLYRLASSEQPAAPSGLVLAPLSVSTALAMTAMGAEGETAVQMCATLHLPNDKEAIQRGFQALASRVRATAEAGRCELNGANGLWGQAGFDFHDTFRERIAAGFGGSFREVDFAHGSDEARRAINTWVGEETRGRIADLLPEEALDSDTRLALVNAIYFKAEWRLQFKVEATMDEPFVLLDGTYRSVPTMRNTGLYGYHRDDDVQLLELPYAEQDCSMLVCLPRDTLGLPNLEAQLSPELIRRWVSSLRERKVNLLLPRFTLESGYEMKPLLARLGMVDAFALDRANFTGLAPERGLHIASVVHQSVIEVTEEGTEAAGAAAVIMGGWGGGSEMIPVFRADRPFFFLILHKPTGSILFMGRLVSPPGGDLPGHVPKPQPDHIGGGGVRMYR